MSDAKTFYPDWEVAVELRTPGGGRVIVYPRQIASVAECEIRLPGGVDRAGEVVDGITISFGAATEEHCLCSYDEFLAATGKYES